jgi:RNA-directed DNA polymerase
MKSRLKGLTSRRKSYGYEGQKHKLAIFIKGWVEYFKLADMKSKLQRIDEWLRRRIRMCIWKYWKKISTKYKNLIKCRIDKYRAWMWVNTRRGYWCTAGSPILSCAITNDKMRKAGYIFLSDYYRKVSS